MSNHLPECPMTTEEGICFSITCICNALRACEERVIAAAERIGYAQALEDALGAVDRASRTAARLGFRQVVVIEILEAMEALRANIAEVTVTPQADEGSGGVTVAKCHYCQRPVFFTRYSVLHLDWTPACQISDTEL